MGTFFKEQLHLKEPFQTYRSLTPLQHTTRTDRMKFLLPILLISLAALCNIQPAAAQAEAEVEAQGDETAANPAEGEAQIEAPGGAPGAVTDELLDTIDAIVAEPTSQDESPELRWGYHQKIALRKWARFFKYADTNKTGALTWSEYWNAVHKILHAKGWSHAQIMKYKTYFYKKFRHMARGGLIRWKDVKR